MQHNRAMRPIIAVVLIALLAACASVPERNPLATWVPSKNFNQRKPVIIVLHFTQQDSVQQSLDTLRSANSGGKVSSHYLVGDDGHIYQLVADSDRAWHAGAARWGTISELNSASIGIEIDNDGKEPYTEPQIAAVIRLLEDLTSRLGIDRSQVIGHSDLAPVRKVDPGAHFPWKRLFDAGFGIWPQGELVDPPAGFDPWRAMAQVGYAVDGDDFERAAAVRAFHQRFRGVDDGEHPVAAFDPEDLRILYALTRGSGLR